MFQPAVKSARPASLLLLSALLVTGFALTATAGEWKGQRVEKEGVVHISNPKTPMEAPATVKLDELWRIGGDSDAEEEFFGVIGRITTDAEGNVYLLDSQLSEVKVFSADGQYLRTLGREGEGPGEFRRPQDMFFLPDGNLGVLQLAPGRIVMLTPEGDPVGDHPLPTAEGGATPILIGGQLMGDKLVLVLNENKMGEGKIDITRCLAMINPQGNEVGRLHSETRTMEFANAVIEERIWSTFDRRWATGPDGSVYAVTQFPDYEINVWAPTGKKTRVITREFERRARSPEQIERVHGIFEAFTRQVPNATLKISDFDQDIAAVFPQHDGSLWVMSSRGMRDCPKGSLGTFDVFDAEGRYLRQATLMGDGDPLQDGYFFVGDRLYVVTGFLDAAMAAAGGASEEMADEAEPMAVICYQVGPLKAGM